MLGKPKHTKEKGLDKKNRLEDLNHLVRQGVMDAIQKKLTRMEMV